MKNEPRWNRLICSVVSQTCSSWQGRSSWPIWMISLWLEKFQNRSEMKIFSFEKFPFNPFWQTWMWKICIPVFDVVKVFEVVKHILNSIMYVNPYSWRTWSTITLEAHPGLMRFEANPNWFCSSRKTNDYLNWFVAIKFVLASFLKAQNDITKFKMKYLKDFLYKKLKSSIEK